MLLKMQWLPARKLNFCAFSVNMHDLGHRNLFHSSLFLFLLRFLTLFRLFTLLALGQRCTVKTSLGAERHVNNAWTKPSQSTGAVFIKRRSNSDKVEFLRGYLTVFTLTTALKALKVISLLVNCFSLKFENLVFP